MSRHDMDALAEQLDHEAEFWTKVLGDQQRMAIAQQEGYTGVCWIRGRGVCGVRQFILTVGVCYGIEESGYDGRFCFDTEQNARLFLKEWDGVTMPEIGVDGCKAIK